MSIERQIARELKMAKMKDDLKGEGQYIFENNTKGDLYLPRPTQSGRRLVRKGEQFVGDNYYFGMLRSNELKLVKELVSPQQQVLMTEQPPVVTNQGPVEFVQPSQSQFNESGRGGQVDPVDS
jgi:hypothetical protein